MRWRPKAFPHNPMRSTASQLRWLAVEQRKFLWPEARMGYWVLPKAKWNSQSWCLAGGAFHRRWILVAGWDAAWVWCRMTVSLFPAMGIRAGKACGHWAKGEYRCLLQLYMWHFNWIFTIISWFLNYLPQIFKSISIPYLRILSWWPQLSVLIKSSAHFQFRWPHVKVFYLSSAHFNNNSKCGDRIPSNLVTASQIMIK